MSNWYYKFIDSVRLKVMLYPYPLQLMKIKQHSKQIRDMNQFKTIMKT